MPLHNNAPSLEEVMQRLANEGESSTPGHDMGVTWVLAKNILRIFSLIPRVLFLRSQFGERYMQAYHVLGSWAVVCFACIGASVAGIGMPWGEGAVSVTSFSIVFLVAYTVMLGLRYFGVLRRKWRNEFGVHSFAEGLPWKLWLKLRLSPALIGLVIEPLILVALGYLLGHLLELPALEFLAWLGATAHFAEQNIILAQERAKLLDAADNIIEKRMAEERLGLVHGHARPAPAIAAPAADQHALQLELAAVRSHAATDGSATARSDQ